MKYTVCIGVHAKNKLDRFRLDYSLGRFPLRHLVHKDYIDNRPPAARREETLSIRQRPVTVQTNLVDTKLVDMLDLVEMLDLVAHHSNTDQAYLSHIVGTFLDAVINGDLVDANAPFLEDYTPESLLVRENQIKVAELASSYNLRKAAAKTEAD